MAIEDFVRKEVEIARRHGVLSAVRQGAGEAAMKALNAATPLVSRPIWADNWDVCLVLDACRLDLWKEVAGVRYGAAGNWSVGSASPEWISNTFADEYRDDWQTAGYVTANPFSGKHGHELEVIDGDVYPLAERGLGYLDEVWRDQWPATDDLPTVAAPTLTDRALWAWQHRDALGFDQLVVHYMQPHIPFRSRPEWCSGWDLEGFGTGGGKGKDDWLRVRDGELDADEFWQAYRDNLEWVLGEVERWSAATNARILVTSDHGNAMGEFGQWSHPPKSGNPVLRNVPWVFVNGTGHRPEDPTPAGNPPVVGQQSGDEESDVSERLRALGYAE